MKTEFIICHQINPENNWLIENTPMSLNIRKFFVKNKHLFLTWGKDPLYTEFLTNLKSYKSKQWAYDTIVEDSDKTHFSIIHDYLFGKFK